MEMLFRTCYSLDDPNLEGEANMAEGSEVEERVDLDEDNYMEEIDDDVLEHLDEDVDGDGGSNGNQDEEQENSKAEASEQELSPNASPTTNNEVEDAEDRPVASLSDEDREKFAHLLSLPPHGSEVFIGGLPRDVMEEDLRDLCEPIGEVFEVRLVKDKGTGESKGYAFVAFKTEELAQKAIEELHSKEFKGKTLRCSQAESKNRLFIGNIPKILKDDEFRKAIEEVGPGVDNIELIKDPQVPSRNRGFAFVLYYNNACAEYSRQKMSSPNFKLDGHNPSVTWADPKSAPDQSAASQVKALYIKNIPENTSTEQLKELFQRHGEVTKVVMPPSKSGSSKRDFGFVHFAERSSALKAVKDSERYEIEGQALEVVLAKPQSDKKSDNSGLHPGQHAYPGYGGGLVANPFGSGYGVSPSYQQPMIYGRGPMPSGMQMVPMVLPDGRIGYVLQQPGVQMAPPHPRPSRRSDRNNGGGGHGGRGSSSGSGNGSEEGSRNRRYRPY